MFSSERPKPLETSTRVPCAPNSHDAVLDDVVSCFVVRRDHRLFTSVMGVNTPSDLRVSTRLEDGYKITGGRCEPYTRSTSH